MSLDKTLESMVCRGSSHLGTWFSSRGASCVLAQRSGLALFAKINSSVEQTLGEAESLTALAAALSSGSNKGGVEERLTPEVHASGGGFTQDFFQAYHKVIPKTEA
ncbi:hypothetical protein NDA18_005146 [Ustilago nuda]|nr:hypothetical protein NDA18_005146 [Ustilago nuda]